MTKQISESVIIFDAKDAEEVFKNEIKVFFDNHRKSEGLHRNLTPGQWLWRFINHMKWEGQWRDMLSGYDEADERGEFRPELIREEE